MSHAIVIGAGPAGSIAAMLLARRGWRVDLIEQHRFPRDKVCGECVSALGIEVLQRASLFDQFVALAPVRLTRAALYCIKGSPFFTDLPAAMFGVSRRRFDAFLLDAARQAGAEIRQPMRCQQVDVGDGGVVVTCRDLTDNAILTLPADVALVADGKAALLPAASRPRATEDLGIKAHFVGVDAPRDAIELFGFDGHYGGVAPIEDAGAFNVALSVPAPRVREFGGDFDALLARLSRENIAFGRQFARATRTGRWLASPLPRFPVVREWPCGVIPLGNAAGAIEPIGGEGMGLAMRSAELAAESLLEGRDTNELRNQFDALWRRRQFVTRAAAVLLSMPAAGAAFDFAVNIPGLSETALRWMGKHAG